jgi:hypothetical protein
MHTTFEKDKFESKMKSKQFRTEKKGTNLIYSHEQPTGFDVVEFCICGSVIQCVHNRARPYSMRI